jgi:hypothetical protein
VALGYSSLTEFAERSLPEISSILGREVSASVKERVPDFLDFTASDLEEFTRLGGSNVLLVVAFIHYRLQAPTEMNDIKSFYGSVIQYRFPVADWARERRHKGRT